MEKGSIALRADQGLDNELIKTLQKRVTKLEKKLENTIVENHLREHIIVKMLDYLRSLGISLEEIKFQNEVILDKADYIQRNLNRNQDDQGLESD